MATYQFSTITTAQALALAPTDTVNIDIGTANAATVLYIPAAGANPDEISLTEGGSTVAFSSAFATATKTFSDGSLLYVGGSGNDAPAALGATNDAMFGGLGDDTLSAGDGSNLLQGNQGSDVLNGGAGKDSIYGGADNDTINVGASANGGFANFAQGNKGDDTISGSPTDDDTILGGQGDDLIGATSFSYSVNNGAVTFHISGQSGGGADYLDGNRGNDTVVGGGSGGVVFGEDGNDLIYDAGTHNTLDGGTGNDSIVAVQGGESISGGAGDDLLEANFGRSGTSGSTLDGGDGNDAINVDGAGNDSLVGGAGDDTLDGGMGSDTMSGGPGADLFQVSDGFGGSTEAQLDTIVDWDGSQDRLFFGTGNGNSSVGAANATNYIEINAADYASALSAANTQMHGGVIEYVSAQVGADVIVFADSNLNHTAGAAVLLIGKTLADISASNFFAG